MKVALVSAADAAYFDLLLGQVRSIHALRQRPPELDVCILDVGLTPEQVTRLKPLVSQIVVPDWAFTFHGVEQSPSWFKALVGRPQLPRYFPGYDIHIWLDADTWLCNADALHQLIHAAGLGKMAIVAEMDRAYHRCFHPQPEDLKRHHENYRLGWGTEIADKYFNRTVINSGVLAMRSDLPFWRIWSETIEQGLERATFPMVEQCALNLAIYTERIPAYFLPSTSNWICCQALPLFDPNTRSLHSPMIPHERISICHLISIKRTPITIACTDGSMREIALTYDGVHAPEIPPPLSR